MSSVAILGCGPAGLMAAHAAHLHGYSPWIFSVKVKSMLPGAQYLHEPIPDVAGPEPDGIIKTILLGTREGYASKMYGRPDAPVSWDQQQPERPAWDLRAAYDRLWSEYQHAIINIKITKRYLSDIRNRFDVVISSVPAPTLCSSSCDHSFFSAEARVSHNWATGVTADNTVVYNGKDDVTWYRAARVFGHTSTEYSGGVCDTSLERAIKVIGTDCDCLPDVYRVGRFGTWQKGHLTHHAYRDAVTILGALG